MKTLNIFWGFFLITIGSLYLISSYSNIYIDWSAVWDLWPVIVILAGISIIVKGNFFKPIIVLLMGILFGFLTFSFINDVFDIVDYRSFNEDSWENYSESDYNIDYNYEIKHVNLNIEGGAGKLYIEKTTDKLVEGYSKGNIGKYILTQTQNDDTVDVLLTMKKTNINLFGKSYHNQFNLSLNEEPTYDFKIQIGASKSYIDLFPFKVENIDLQTGATDAKIKLGNKSDKTNLDIQMGAASLKVYVPKTSGCIISGDMALVAKYLDKFQRDEDGNYITENYDSASKIVHINIQGGLAKFKVKRY